MGTINLAPEVERVIAEATGSLGMDAVENYLNDKKIMDEFHSKLNLALSTAQDNYKKLPVVIFVDELDRCRPLYAIELLERIKHLFNVESAVFVVAMDKKQLGISLGAVYGQGFNSTEYLRRFFDLELRLTQISNDKFCESLIKRMELEEFFESRTDQVGQRDFEDLKATFLNLSRLLNLTLRGQEKCMVLLALAMLATQNTEYFYPVQTVIMAALRIGAEEIYNRVSRENGSVVEIIDHLEKMRVERGGIDELNWSGLVGYILSMRDSHDQLAIQLLDERKRLWNTARDNNQYDDGLELIISITSDRHNRGNTLKTVIKRIDIAAQFQN